MPQRAKVTRTGTVRSGTTRRNQPGQRRRPRIAGHSRHQSGPPLDAERETTDEPARPRTRVDRAPPAPKGISAWSPKRRLIAMATALGIALGLAGWFGYQTVALRTDPVARNAALVDVGASAQAISQISTAMERVYSFDYTRLDENERVAGDLITPEFADDFATLFEQVRKLAPQQQAVVSATVAMAAVRELEGDRAVLVIFLDQQATRGADAKQLLASGRVTVSAQLVDGKWKIAGVDSR